MRLRGLRGRLARGNRLRSASGHGLWAHLPSGVRVAVVESDPDEREQRRGVSDEPRFLCARSPRESARARDRALGIPENL